MKRFILIMIMPILLTACDMSEQDAIMNRMKQIESQQQTLEERIPVPVLSDSLERRNIAARLERVNAANLNGYIYLISYGKIMAYYPVKGKVSSLNSYLVPQEQIIGLDNKVTVSAPDVDGSYGFNDNGIFFFTTTDAYVEWKGEYLWSDQPLSLSQQPELIMQISQ